MPDVPQPLFTDMDLEDDAQLSRDVIRGRLLEFICSCNDAGYSWPARRSAVDGLVRIIAARDAAARLSPESDLPRIIRASYLDAATYMEQNGLWTAPWTSYIAQEYPGLSLSIHEAALVQARVASAIASSKLNEFRIKAKVREITSYLAAKGYPATIEDSIPIGLIASALFPLPETPPEDPHIRGRRLARMGLRTASNPQHSAWQDVLDHFLPL